MSFSDSSRASDWNQQMREEGELRREWEETNEPPESQYPEILVMDMNDTEIKVGTRVVYFDSEDQGVVTAISDIDGDVDDETGRSILVPPQITVKWDTSGTEKYWSRYQGGSYYDGKMKFEVEDVDVIPNVH